MSPRQTDDPMRANISSVCLSFFFFHFLYNIQPTDKKNANKPRAHSSVPHISCPVQLLFESGKKCDLVGMFCIMRSIMR